MLERVRTVARAVGSESGGRRGCAWGWVSSRYSSAARDWGIMIDFPSGFSMMRVGTLAEGFRDVFWLWWCSFLSRLMGMEV